jgi:hypothetical protein
MFYNMVRTSKKKNTWFIFKKVFLNSRENKKSYHVQNRKNWARADSKQSSRAGRCCRSWLDLQVVVAYNQS